MSYCSDLTRERIMECAKAEFLKKGFQAAQLKDIVAAAKVTTGAVYRHFKDKEALFFALIEDVYHYTLDFLDNGELLADEHYGKEVMLDPGIAAESITLGDDEYFVLGDNRNHSSDSRDPSVGVLHRKDLIGRAWVRIWPFSDIGFIRHD